MFAVGRIVKPFGIRGEVIVRPLSSSSGRFSRMKHVFVGTDEQHAVSMGVKSVDVRKQGVRMTLEGVPGRTEAERLVGAFVFVADEDRIALPPATYFVHDVVGMKVVDQTARVVGNVKEVLHMPASDVYVVERDGREMMIPAVKEFVKKYDLDQKTLYVYLIDGMEPHED